jgi:hypothetical protein
MNYQETPKRKRNNFIDNKKFYQELVNYSERCEARKQEHKLKELPVSEFKPPEIPRYVAECFMLISEHLSQKPNFSGYIFREDMVCDGIENCISACRKFDPTKSKNPFSYFTQICWYAFLRRIAKEKRQIEICDKIITRSGFETFFEGDMMGNHSDYDTIKDNVEQKTRANK